jgi:hypothetical protein
MDTCGMPLVDPVRFREEFFDSASDVRIDKTDFPLRQCSSLVLADYVADPFLNAIAKQALNRFSHSNNDELGSSGINDTPIHLLKRTD